MKHRAILGGLLWLLALLLVGRLLSAAEFGPGWSRLWRYATRSPQTVTITVPEAEALSPGERVLGTRDGRFEALGRVVSVAPPSQGERVITVACDPERPPIRVGGRFKLVDARGDMTWALQTILPEAKMKRIKTELMAFKDSHEAEIMEIAQLVSRELVSQGIDTLEANLAEAVNRHEKEWSAVLDKHRVGLKRDLLPILKERMGPTVKEKLKPVLTEIGKELWDALPIWSVTWRALVDQVPGVRQRYMEAWWQDFLDNKAIPIVKAHENEFIELGETLFLQASQDPEVRKGLAKIARELVADRDFRVLVNTILNEALVEPFQGQRFFDKLMEDKEIRERVDALAAAFAPTMKEMARIVVEDENNGGLNPDLVEVVRRVFFERQARALYYEHPTDAPGAIAGPDTPFRIAVLRPPAREGPAEGSNKPRPSGDF